MGSVPVSSIENANCLDIFDWKSPKETDEANLVVDLEIPISSWNLTDSVDSSPSTRALKTCLGLVCLACPKVSFCFVNG